MDDFIRRPRQPLKPQPPVEPPVVPPIAERPHVLPVPHTVPAPQAGPVPDTQIVAGPPPPPPTEPVKPPRSKKHMFWWIGAAIALLLIGGIAGWVWYQNELSPVNPRNEERVTVTIEPNAVPMEIAQILKDEELIRSVEAFTLYTRLTGLQGSLQAGTYRLSQSESTPEIVAHLTNGNVDTIDITFLPGATLAEHKEVLSDAGYGEEEIDQAFAASYDSPLFDGKPVTADLEGYIYGETYRVASSASVEDILRMTFAEFESTLTTQNLRAGFAAQDLSLFQAITLASIIQRESIGGDEPQIAQVFYRRLAEDMVLGSDVTYQYIADKTGVARDVNLDSPYNTRRYPGLPPGPIASPGLASLKAVASPAAGDYLFFLSGDDDVTYFARTLEEHEANIRAHCQQKCQII